MLMQATMTTTTNPTIRRMTGPDVREVIAIEQRSYPYPWTEMIFRDCLKAGYHGFVLFDDAGTIGYVMVSYAVGEAHLLNLCIHPQHRGQGHARLLLAHAIEQVRMLGADTLFLEVRVSNDAAIGLYQAMGFNELAVRPNYYPADKGREDALLMARVL